MTLFDRWLRLKQRKLFWQDGTAMTLSLLHWLSVTTCTFYYSNDANVLRLFVLYERHPLSSFQFIPTFFWANFERTLIFYDGFWNAWSSPCFRWLSLVNSRPCHGSHVFFVVVNFCPNDIHHPFNGIQCFVQNIGFFKFFLLVSLTYFTHTRLLEKRLASTIVVKISSGDSSAQEK